MKPDFRSLRFRLVATVAAIVGALWLTAVVWMHYELDTSLDESVASDARVVLATLPRELLEQKDLTQFKVPGITQEDKVSVYFQMWDTNGRLVYRTANVSDQPLDPHFNEGWSWQYQDKQRWRVFGVRDAERKVIVLAAIPQQLVDKAFHSSILETLVLSFAVCWPLLGLAIWLAVSWSLRPLRNTAAQLSARPDDDAAAIAVTHMPSELQPFVNAINDLLSRLSRAREVERAFIADAAHELRTPLAALRVQVQVAIRATTEAERMERLTKVQQGIDRTTRLAVQMLDLARIDAFDLTGRRKTVDLADCCRAAITELEMSAAFARVVLENNLQSVSVDGDIDLLITLVRNLMDNALRHGAAGGYILVVTRVEDAIATLEVTDRGPGIPASERAHVFERFARAENGMSSGAGLGLAIVKRIVEAHGADIELSSPAQGSGLLVRVRFHAVSPALQK